MCQTAIISAQLTEADREISTPIVMNPEFILNWE